ncbi:MAG TPA: hydrogenase maturation nickel metallochaperone HypA [Stellaceae bacterium]|nr:hydrogenase maturation nickel metallochaperone HypA [Stellaceae bacterium]
MNEIAIACCVVAHVAGVAGGRRVHRITLEIGKLSGVRPSAVAACFADAARGTAAEAARLDIREINGRAYCRSCGSEFALADLRATCPCGSTEFHPIAGEELNLKSIVWEPVLVGAVTIGRRRAQ